MATLQQLRNSLRVMIDQPESNSKFTIAELNTLLNDAQAFISDVTANPRDIIGVTVEKSIGAYQLPSDNLTVKQCWIGDPTQRGDIYELTQISLKGLSALHPNWLETTTESEGDPKYFTFLNKTDLFIYPRPNAQSAGKDLIVCYVFRPQTMDTDADVALIPLAYHSLIPLYAAHLCYDGKLGNAEESAKKYALFERKLKLLEDPVQQEADAAAGFEFISVPDLA